MTDRTKALIATGAAILLCGCPGLLLCVSSALTATGNMPFSTTVNDVTNSGTLPPTTAWVGLCLSLILIIIPIAVGFFTLRRKPGSAISGDPTVPPPT